MYVIYLDLTPDTRAQTMSWLCFVMSLTASHLTPLFSVRSVRPPQHWRSHQEDKGTAQPVQHQPETVRRGGVGPVSGLRVRPAGQTQALAHAHSEGQGALHQDEDLPGGRDGRPQAGGQPVQDCSGQTDENGNLQSNGWVLLLQRRQLI